MSSFRPGDFAMFRSLATAATLAVSLPATPSAASNLGKAIIGGGAAVIIGCATGALNCNGNRQRSRTSTRSRAPQMSAAQRAQIAETKSVQQALNAFGFNVGGADGQAGPKTRAGISQYQAYMGYPATGHLDEYQKGFLLSSHQRALASGAYPTRDMLHAFRNEAQGNGGYAQVPGQGNGAYPQGNNGFAQGNGYGHGAVPNQNGFAETNPQFANAPQAGNTGPAPSLPVLQKPGGSGLMAASGGSMAERCEVIDLLSQSSGVIQAGQVTDPDQALSQQFCAMRSYAISEGQKIMTAYKVNDEMMRSDICGPIAAQMADAAGAPGDGAPNEVAIKASEVSRSMGVTDPATARDYGRMCLSVGYRADDPDLAAGGALMMLGQGDYAYAEVIGHHLREGFGAPADSEAAMPWYNAALDTLSNGATPAFLPAQSANRVAVMRSALSLGTQASDGEMLPGVVPVSSAPVLPVLQKSE